MNCGKSVTGNAKPVASKLLHRTDARISHMVEVILSSLRAFGQAAQQNHAHQFCLAAGPGLFEDLKEMGVRRGMRNPDPGGLVTSRHVIAVGP